MENKNTRDWRNGSAGKISAARAENSGSVPSTDMIAYNCQEFQFQGLSFGLLGYQALTYMQGKDSYT